MKTNNLVNESRTENEENTRQVGQTGGYRVRRKGQPTVFVGFL